VKAPVLSLKLNNYLDFEDLYFKNYDKVAIKAFLSRNGEGNWLI
jgi:hypothetical protein